MALTGRRARVPLGMRRSPGCPGNTPDTSGSSPTIVPGPRSLLGGRRAGVTTNLLDQSCWTGKALRPLKTARTGRSAIHMERLAASSARSHKLRSWFSVAEWSDGLVGRHRALEARGSPTGAAFGGFDPSCRLPTRAVPGSHRAPSGGPRAPPHGLGQVDGRTGGAHRNPRDGKGVNLDGGWLGRILLSQNSFSSRICPHKCHIGVI